MLYSHQIFSFLWIRPITVLVLASFGLSGAAFIALQKALHAPGSILVRSGPMSMLTTAADALHRHQYQQHQQHQHQQNHLRRGPRLPPPPPPQPGHVSLSPSSSMSAPLHSGPVAGTTSTGSPPPPTAPTPGEREHMRAVAAGMARALAADQEAVKSGADMHRPYATRADALARLLPYHVLQVPEQPLAAVVMGPAAEAEIAASAANLAAAARKLDMRVASAVGDAGIRVARAVGVLEAVAAVSASERRALQQQRMMAAVAVAGRRHQQHHHRQHGHSAQGQYEGQQYAGQNGPPPPPPPPRHDQRWTQPPYRPGPSPPHQQPPAPPRAPAHQRRHHTYPHPQYTHHLHQYQQPSPYQPHSYQQDPYQPPPPPPPPPAAHHATLRASTAAAAAAASSSSAARSVSFHGDGSLPPPPIPSDRGLVARDVGYYGHLPPPMHMQPSPQLPPPPPPPPLISGGGSWSSSSPAVVAGGYDGRSAMPDSDRSFAGASHGTGYDIPPRYSSPPPLPPSIGYEYEGSAAVTSAYHYPPLPPLQEQRYQHQQYNGYAHHPPPPPGAADPLPGGYAPPRGCPPSRPLHPQQYHQPDPRQYHPPHRQYLHPSHQQSRWPATIAAPLQGFHGGAHPLAGDLGGGHNGTEWPDDGADQQQQQ
ncbi:hypothetical protein BC828DRAFT_416668 [Blastocladiella britannica]|nr:hypothetical protein BC828DRAFT_416668 [Blastocladiella britannica]